MPRRQDWIPNNFVTMLNLTHDLRIPLLSSRSRTKLEAMRHRLMTDPDSRYIPDEGFLWPEMMSLNLGSLSLSSEEDVVAATAHLKSLNLNELLRGLREKSPKRGFPDLTKSATGQLTDADELIRVSVTGLQQPCDIRSEDKLLTTVLDPDGVLVDFLKTIERSFFEAGWLRRTSSEAKIFNSMKLVSTRRLCTPMRKTKPSVVKQLPERRAIYKILRLNVEDLFAKYQEHVWASDIALERLSIFKLGFHDFKRGAVLVGQGNQEVASVPLPGAPDIDLRAERKGLTYEKTGKDGFFIPGATYDVTKR